MGKRRFLPMAYRYGNRNQITLFPQSIEEYVSQDDPVRVYDAFVEALNFDNLGIVLDQNKVGSPEYNPKVMVKLLIYGYSYGIRSSRKLERAAHHNISFIWLLGSLKPDHKTIARFRRDNALALKKILKQCVRMCVKLDIIAGNTLFIDGSKFRANASIKNTWNEKDCHKALKEIERRIDDILAECEAADQAEENNPSLIKLEENLNENKKLKEKIAGILQEINKSEDKITNTTDSDSRSVHSVHGTHAGYNVQSVVDDKHGLIVNTDVTNEGTDSRQFAKQIDKAQEILKKKPQEACGDAGYAATGILEEVHNQGIRVIVPSQRQALKVKPGRFDKSHFKYNKENDTYTCPEGFILHYSYTRGYKPQRVYKITDPASHCVRCKHFGVCTKAKGGRSIDRLIKEELKEKFEEQYNELQSQDIYRRRKYKVEPPFGHIKRNLGAGTFLLRGFDGTNAEMSILSACYNLRRMMTIAGIQRLIETFTN